MNKKILLVIIILFLLISSVGVGLYLYKKSGTTQEMTENNETKDTVFGGIMEELDTTEIEDPYINVTNLSGTELREHYAKNYADEFYLVPGTCVEESVCFSDRYVLKATVLLVDWDNKTVDMTLNNGDILRVNMSPEGVFWKGSDLEVNKHTMENLKGKYTQLWITENNEDKLFFDQVSSGAIWDDR